MNEKRIKYAFKWNIFKTQNFLIFLPYNLNAIDQLFLNWIKKKKTIKDVWIWENPNFDKETDFKETS